MAHDEKISVLHNIRSDMKRLIRSAQELQQKADKIIVRTHRKAEKKFQRDVMRLRKQLKKDNRRAQN